MRIAELYDALTGDFSVIGETTVTDLYWSGVIRLSNGRVLLPGTDPEIYDPATNIFNATNETVTRHSAHAAALLPDGTVMIVGGGGWVSGSYRQLREVDLYDPKTGIFSTHSTLPKGRQQHTVTVLASGEVLTHISQISPVGAS